MELRLRIENDMAFLVRAGRPCICPYQTRLITAGAMAGTASINNAVCSSNCPLFEITPVKVRKDWTDFGLKPEPDAPLYTIGLCNDKYYANVPLESKEKPSENIHIFPKRE